MPHLITSMTNDQLDQQMTETEKLYKICILDLLIAIDEDVVDWRDHPKLWTAIQKADIALDLWAGMNLKQIKQELEHTK
jgi:hypothetical protein